MTADPRVALILAGVALVATIAGQTLANLI
jgi:hypothetical protein